MKYAIDGCPFTLSPARGVGSGRVLAVNFTTRSNLSPYLLVMICTSSHGWLAEVCLMMHINTGVFSYHYEGKDE